MWYGFGSIYGGGLNSAAASCHLENTLITFSRMGASSGLVTRGMTEYEVRGGGLHLLTPCSLVSCTLADNSIMDPPGVDSEPMWGGQALFGDLTGSVGSTMTNSIVWNGPFGMKGNLPQISFSDVDGQFLPPGPGNIQAFPIWDMLDYRLLVGSPCIDVADDSAAPLTDFYGNGRFDLSGVGTSLADMGAIEYQGP